jgi:hypothetical protein
MLREATYPPAAVNVLDVSSESMAAFQVILYGRFWVFTEGRLCSLMEAILASDPKPFASDQPVRKVLDGLLGTLVRMGIADAHRLEESLRLATN